MDILIKGMEMPSCCDKCFFVKKCSAHAVQLKKMSESEHEQIFDVFGEIRLKGCHLIPVPEHNDLADKAVIIERMGEVYEALYDKVDKKALSECHVAFLKAVMYAPTVIPSTVKIPTDGIEPKGVWNETWTTDSDVVLERTT